MTLTGEGRPPQPGRAPASWHPRWQPQPQATPRGTRRPCPQPDISAEVGVLLPELVQLGGSMVSPPAAPLTRLLPQHPRCPRHPPPRRPLPPSPPAQIRELDPHNDLKFLRLRSSKYEVMVAPYPDFSVIVLQQPVAVEDDAPAPL